MGISNQGNEMNVRSVKPDGAYTSTKTSLFGRDGLNFRDVIDLINPLHHIPIVGRIYRAITNDQIAPGIRIAGGTVFGGPIGAAFAAAGLAVDKAGELFSQKIDASRLARVEKNVAPTYSIDEVIARRKIPLDPYKNLDVQKLVSASDTRLIRGNLQLVDRLDWPYSTRQRHMPFVKISQLIEDNYRFLENESDRHSVKDLGSSKFDRRL